MTLAAVLGDLDGLTVDNEPLWTIAEIELARSVGEQWTNEVMALVVDTRLDRAVPSLPWILRRRTSALSRRR